MEKTYLDEFICCHMKIFEKMLNDIKKKYKIKDDDFISKYIGNLNKLSPRETIDYSKK